MDSLTTAIVDLIKDDNNTGSFFYGSLLSSMKKEYTDKVKAVTLKVNKEGIKLQVNKEYFEGLSLQIQKEWLVHNCAHLIHFHTQSRQGNMLEKDIFSISCDASISKYTPKLKELGMPSPEMFGLKPDDATEYYYSELMKQKNKNNSLQAMCKEGISKDDIEMFSDDIGQEKAERMIRQALKDAKNRAGKVPDAMKLLFESWFSSKTQWKQHLRNFCLNTIKTGKKKLRNKLSRRVPYSFQGKKKLRKANLVIIADTSGSMWGEDGLLQKMVLPEIMKIKETLGVDINIIHCDADVQKVEVLTSKTKPIEFAGGGGTLLSPALEYILKNMDIDGIMYATDGQIFDKPDAPKKPFMWILPEGKEFSKPVSWGKEVRISEKG